MNCDYDISLTCSRCGHVALRLPTYRRCPAVPGNDQTQSAIVPIASGPGTELSRLLARFGIEPTPNCACRAKAAQMNAWGPDECSKPERIEEVVAVMREEAKARGLPFLDVAGRLLVKRAIANARREMGQGRRETARERPQ